jgi:hypothetical protein
VSVRPPSSPASAEVSEEAAPATSHVATFADIPKLVVVSAGLGVTAADVSGSTPDSSGFYGAAEFVLVPSMWFSPRLYGGVLFTSTDTSTCPTPACDVSTKIGFLGVKGRLTLPIPYVAPFAEVGLGVSVGALTTRLYDTDVEYTGVTYHIPLALGLSIGEMHHYVVDIAFSTLVHPAQLQSNGALALSIAFPLQ